MREVQQAMIECLPLFVQTYGYVPQSSGRAISVQRTRRTGRHQASRSGELHPDVVLLGLWGNDRVTPIFFP